MYIIVYHSIGDNIVSILIEKTGKGFGKLKYFKIIAAQDKSIFGSCASLSRYVKKYYDTNLSKMGCFADRKTLMR